MAWENRAGLPFAWRILRPTAEMIDHAGAVGASWIVGGNFLVTLTRLGVRLHVPRLRVHQDILL